MRIIKRKSLKDFWKKHGDIEQSLKAWFAEVKKANRTTPNDVIKDYPTASIIDNNRIVFRIKGNRYRLIVAISYLAKIVWIKFIGTHQEYDKIDAESISKY